MQDGFHALAAAARYKDATTTLVHPSNPTQLLLATHDGASLASFGCRARVGADHWRILRRLRGRLILSPHGSLGGRKVVRIPLEV